LVNKLKLSTIFLHIQLFVVTQEIAKLPEVFTEIYIGRKIVMGNHLIHRSLSQKRHKIISRKILSGPPIPSTEPIHSPGQ
jgi:hypothetical protein